MSLANKILSACGGSADKLYVDDVFSAWLRTGTGADVTVTTGIDMTKGYCLHTKGRSGATDHAVYHSARGVTKDLATNSTAAETTQATGLKSVSATGHTIGALAKMNTSAATYVDWIFRDADNFHAHTVVTKSAGSNATVSFPGLVTLGMVRVKRTDSSGSWYVWHRSLTAGKLLIGETTAAEATLGHITVSGTTLTLVNGVIADGTYLVEAFAHDPSADGIIQCGSFTTDSGANGSVNLGWEPQLVLAKQSGSVGNWWVLDIMRGMPAQPGNEGDLSPNLSATEANPSTTGGKLTSTGFVWGEAISKTYIYLAIRRPNKPPTSGTQVYNAIARTGTGAAATVTGVGFAPDLAHVKCRSSGVIHLFADRLRGSGYLQTQVTNAENSITTVLPSNPWDVMDGLKVGSSTSNTSAETYINHFFRRAPGVMDQICTNGSGANKTEAIPVLGVPPELWLHKSRSGTTQWVFGSSLLAATEKIVMPSPAGKVTDATAWNSTYPTASVISFGTAAAVNTAAETYTTYMWATLAGISKVGLAIKSSGSDLNVNCGFSAGARFVMLVRTDAAGDIYLWDTVRGIVAGNDPYLLLNTIAPEVTITDYIDPYAAGFTIVNGGLPNGTYLYLAYA